MTADHKCHRSQKPQTIETKHSNIADYVFSFNFNIVRFIDYYNGFCLKSVTSQYLMFDLYSMYSGNKLLL